VLARGRILAGSFVEVPGSVAWPLLPSLALRARS